MRTSMIVVAQRWAAFLGLAILLSVSLELDGSSGCIDAVWMGVDAAGYGLRNQIKSKTRRSRQSEGLRRKISLKSGGRGTTQPQPQAEHPPVAETEDQVTTVSTSRQRNREAMLKVIEIPMFMLAVAVYVYVLFFGASPSAAALGISLSVASAYISLSTPINNSNVKKSVRPNLHTTVSVRPRPFTHLSIQRQWSQKEHKDLIEALVEFLDENN